METRTRKGVGTKARGGERGVFPLLPLNAGPGAGGRLISNLSGVGLQPFMLCPPSTASTPFCRANAPAASAKLPSDLPRLERRAYPTVPSVPRCVQPRISISPDVRQRGVRTRIVATRRGVHPRGKAKKNEEGLDGKGRRADRR